jgi:hypothetical protein
VPLEGVVHALHRIHAALVPDGLLVDTQPVSADPPIRLGETELGRLDMRAWAQLIAAVDRETGRVVDAGLYRLEDERSFTVSDAYDDGPELMSYVRDWKGTKLPPALVRTLRRTAGPLSLDQEIRLRLYRGVQIAIPAATSYQGPPPKGD